MSFVRDGKLYVHGGYDTGHGVLADLIEVGVLSGKEKRGKIVCCPGSDRVECQRRIPFLFSNHSLHLPRRV